MKEQHSMRLVKKHETGVQEWSCDECERHFAMQSDPFKIIVFKQGNELVTHTGGAMGNVNIKAGENNGRKKGGQTLH